MSHYENNYVGAVKRPNAIGTQLAELDFAKAPVFMINGLKREELIATNSMILHEAYFQGLGGGGAPKGALADGIMKDFGSINRWRTESRRWAKPRVVAQAGLSSPIRRGTSGWSTNGRPIIRRPWRGGRPVLVLDMYEHAYHMDYGAKAASYVDIYGGDPWENAAKLYEGYSREG